MIKVLRGRWIQIFTVAGVVVLLGMFVGLVIVVLFVWKQNVETGDWTMIWTAVYAAFTAFIAAALFFAGVAAVSQIRSMERARQGQLLTELSRRWEELWECRQKANRFQGNPVGLHQALMKLERRNHRDYFALVRLPNFFEDLGILVDEDIISAELVKNSRGGQIKYYWDLYQCYIRAQQKIRSTTFENFGTLVDELKKLD